MTDAPNAAAPVSIRGSVVDPEQVGYRSQCRASFSRWTVSHVDIQQHDSSNDEDDYWPEQQQQPRQDDVEGQPAATLPPPSPLHPAALREDMASFSGATIAERVEGPRGEEANKDDATNAGEQMR